MLRETQLKLKAEENLCFCKRLKILQKECKWLKNKKI